VTRVVIADLRDNTFFANLIVERAPEVLSVDARPSDSIAIALRCQAPIFVDDRLLEHQTQPEKSEAERAEELRRYLENLDPEDFGKYSP
jgi:bifunctional DNase/RNase